MKKAIVNKRKIVSPKKTMDARMKIIQKNRKNIHDAREKIQENARKHIKDARELLSAKKPIIAVKSKKVVPKARIPRSRAAHLTMDDDLLMDDDDVELEDLDKFKTKPIGSLQRTVRNDNFRKSSPPLRGMPKLPTFSIQNREVSPTIDPFDCYVVPTRRPVQMPPLNLSKNFQPSRIMSAHMDAYTKDEPGRSILRNSGHGHDDRFETDRYVSAEPKSKNSSRYVSESAGIFAKISSPPRSSSSSVAMIKGFRIIVSNLDSGITEGEIRELFSDIGEVMSAKIIRAGTAEVIYRNIGDDERAHEAYHNRILDGRPMKIILAGTTAKSAAYYRM